jgi:inhibitor of cysteine peptidase
MRGTKLALITGLTVALCSCFLGCADNDTHDDNEIVEATGTVTYLSFEGGFYGIVAGDEEHYDPINLSEEFCEDGLQVWFRARIRDDLASFHMWGRIVELLEIREL